MFTSFIVSLVATLLPFMPSPHDWGGLGLRVGLKSALPFLQSERIEQVVFDLTLINLSKEAREHDPLVVATETGALRLGITGPDGKLMENGGGFYSLRDPFTQKNKLRPGESASDQFVFAVGTLVQTGRYKATATLMIDGKELGSPPLEFEVVKVPDDAILVTYKLPVQGRELARPVEKREQAAVQQVKLGDRVWLVYRRFTAKGHVCFTRRVVALPGKAEMTVEGAHGEWGPIKITYKTSATAEPTKVAIQSVDGMPWGESEERTWQEMQRAKESLPPAKK